MRIVKKVIIPAEEEVFSPVPGDPSEVFEIVGTDAIAGEISDFVPTIQDEIIPEEPDIPEGPTGPPGPQGEIGPQGPAGLDGGGTAETWTEENPTTSTDFSGIPAGSLIPVGTSSIEILKSMLYPVTISFTSFDVFTEPNVARYYHVGDSIPQNIYESSWNLNGSSSALENSLRINGLVNGGTPISFTGSPSDINAVLQHGPYSLNSEGTKTFSVAVTGAYNDTISRNDSYFWRYPMYAGKTAGGSISPEDLPNLLVTTNPTGGKNPFIFYSLSTMRSGITFQFPSSSSDEYLYWAVPKAISGASTVTTIANYPEYDTQFSFTNVSNPSVPQSVSMNEPFTLTATNFGLSIVFDVYKSVFAFAGNVSIQVKEV